MLKTNCFEVNSYFECKNAPTDDKYSLMSKDSDQKKKCGDNRKGLHFPLKA